MKNRLIPSGEIEFRGTQEQLLDAIQKAGGILEADNHFRCILPPPKQTGIQLSFLRTRTGGWVFFQFLCEYVTIPSGFRIRYRVMPTFFTWSVPVLLAAMAISACRQFASLYPLWIVGMTIPLVLLFFLWERTKQLDQFLEIFKGQS